MHPVQVIVDALATVIASAAPTSRVYKYRTTRLSDDAGELPALIINVGSDVPFPALATFGTLGSALTVTVDIIDRAADEESLVNAMHSMRRAIHAAVMPFGALNLAYVVEVGYLGADEFASDSSGEMFVKRLSTRWQVAYTMNRDDPNV